MRYFVKRRMLDYVREVGLLSVGMLREWRYKCNFVSYPYIFEGVSYEMGDETVIKLWGEFKEIWCIDVCDYDESKYNEKVRCITEIYFDEDFLDYLRGSNHERFNEYSVIEQYEICEYYVYTLCESIISSESEFDEALRVIKGRA
jgi:hypothetical protein